MLGAPCAGCWGVMHAIAEVTQGDFRTEVCHLFLDTASGSHGGGAGGTLCRHSVLAKAWSLLFSSRDEFLRAFYLQLGEAKLNANALKTLAAVIAVALLCT